MNGRGLHQVGGGTDDPCELRLSALPPQKAIGSMRFSEALAISCAMSGYFPTAIKIAFAKTP